MAVTKVAYGTLEGFVQVSGNKMRRRTEHEALQNCGQVQGIETEISQIVEDNCLQAVLKIYEAAFPNDRQAVLDALRAEVSNCY